MSNAHNNVLHLMRINIVFQFYTLSNQYMIRRAKFEIVINKKKTEPVKCSVYKKRCEIS